MKRLKLPNGKTAYYIDKLTALDVYREIYTEQEYFRGGIHINDGDTVLDVGANIGLFSRYIVEHFPACHVEAFEPVPMIADVFEANLASSHDHARLHRIGLSDTEETIEFQYYPRVSADSAAVPFDWDRKVAYYVSNWDAITKGIPGAKLVPNRWREGTIKRFLHFLYRGIAVRCLLRPLSTVLAELGIARVDLLKIDAENYERQVIGGITRGDWDKIRQVAMEVHQHVTGGEHLLDTFSTLFKERGFDVEIGSEYSAPGSDVFMFYAWK